MSYSVFITGAVLEQINDDDDDHVLCIRLEKVSRRYDVKLLVILLSLLFGTSERSCQSTRTKINLYS